MQLIHFHFVKFFNFFKLMKHIFQTVCEIDDTQLFSLEELFVLFKTSYIFLLTQTNQFFFLTSQLYHNFIIYFVFILLCNLNSGLNFSSQSPDIGKNSDGGISNFQISGKSFIKENCHNSRASDDIDMKLGLVTKVGKKNKSNLTKVDDDAMSENCDAIVIFTTCGQFGAIPKKVNRTMYLLKILTD